MAVSCKIFCTIVWLLLLAVGKCENRHLFTNHFVAEIGGGKHEAQRLAHHYNLRLMDTNLIYPDIYHLMDHKKPRLNGRPSWKMTRSMKGHIKVKYVEQQILRARTSRKLITPLNSFPWFSKPVPISFNDPFYPKLWHLHGRGFYVDKNKSAINLNVEPVWKQGYTGRGVTLFVLDDGLQAKNKEIAPNFESVNSWDVSDMNHPMPSPAPKNPDDSHGTFCAGAMAAAANNSVCGLGVAFNSKIGGIRVLGNRALTDMQESLSLTLWLSNADVVSASWGPRDNGKTVEGPKRLATRAFRTAATKGRKGKGAILVWAAGNGGIFGDNANCDGYASSIYTITIGALSHDGESCVYSERGASVLASVAVTGFALGMLGVSVVVPSLDGTCKQNFQGTSAAAPLAGGVIALLLEANPDLTWRDVQHLIVITSQKTGAGESKNWHRNGAGFHFSLKHGFGAINAELLINAGKYWNNLPPQKKEMHNFPHDGSLSLPPMKNSTLSVVVENSDIKKLEHVIVTLTIHHYHRGLLEIFLTSPAGTKSQLLTKRHKDDSKKGFISWPFMSVHFWGEEPKGLWQVTLSNDGKQQGKLTSANLIFYGH